MVFNVFDKAIPTETLSHGDPEIHQYLNYNPSLVNYTSSDIQLSLGRDPSETDRGGWRGYFRVYSKYFSALKNMNPQEFLKIYDYNLYEKYGEYDDSFSPNEINIYKDFAELKIQKTLL